MAQSGDKAADYKGNRDISYKSDEILPVADQKCIVRLNKKKIEN